MTHGTGWVKDVTKDFSRIESPKYMARHVFIDNSNVFGGAQRAAATLEPEALWLAVRVYYRNLFQLVERGEDVARRVLAGSVPPGNEALWEYARRGGYDTDLLRRVEADDGRLIEQGVDEMLHLKIANALLDSPSGETLVIVSGDGRESGFDTSFPGQAKRSLRQGWNVEVWSWKEQLTRLYEPLVQELPDRVSVRLLDPHYRSITFAQAGSYKVDGSQVDIAGRVVARLR